MVFTQKQLKWGGKSSDDYENRIELVNFVNTIDANLGRI